MRTVNEIKMSYDQLMTNLAGIDDEIDSGRETVLQLEEQIYEEATHHDSSKFLTFIDRLMAYARLISLTQSSADELLSLRDEISEKIAIVKSYGDQYKDAVQHIESLVNFAMECEALSGELNALSGQVDEIMLNFTNLYLSNSVVHNSIERVMHDRQDIVDFCAPWVRYHEKTESNPLKVALQSLQLVNVSTAGLVR